MAKRVRFWLQKTRLFSLLGNLKLANKPGHKSNHPEIANGLNLVGYKHFGIEMERLLWLLKRKKMK